MPTNRRKRLRECVSRLSEDQEQHLLERWVLDVCEPWFQKLGFPFRSDEHRREVWMANREYLLSKCPPGTIADAAQRAGADIVLVFSPGAQTIVGALHFPDPNADPAERFRIVFPETEH